MKHLAGIKVSPKWERSLGLVILFAMLAGCAQTVSSQPAVVNQVASGENSAASGFFGSDLSLLQPGQEGQAAMVYVNPRRAVEPVQQDNALSRLNSGTIPAVKCRPLISIR